MIHLIKNIDLDIAIGADNYGARMDTETENIKYFRNTVYLRGFRGVFIVLSKAPLPENKGVLPKEPRIPQAPCQGSTIGSIIEFISYSCPIKLTFKNDHDRSPINETIIRHLSEAE